MYSEFIHNKLFVIQIVTNNCHSPFFVKRKTLQKKEANRPKTEQNGHIDIKISPAPNGTGLCGLYCFVVKLR